MVFKSLRKNYLAKKSLIVRWLIEKSVTKNMNMFLLFGNFNETIKNYPDLYLKFDVLLFADMFERFRNNSLTNYGLYPSHYLSALGLNWDAMLKITKIELELIPDPDMYIFFEKGTSGAFLLFLIDIAKPTINI